MNQARNENYHNLTESQIKESEEEQKEQQVYRNITNSMSIYRSSFSLSLYVGAINNGNET